jgi:hypothetical protein
MSKPDTYYCTLHNKYFYVSEVNNHFIKLNNFKTNSIIKQLQFSIGFFNQLFKDRKIILQ